MEPIKLDNKRQIERYLRRAPYLHLYGLGDLDDFFWPDTVWYALQTGSEIDALALLYRDRSFSVLE